MSTLTLTKDEIDLINTFLAHREITLSHFITASRNYKDHTIFQTLSDERRLIQGLIEKIHILRRNEK